MTPDEELLNFPCEFPVKAMGYADSDLPHLVETLVAGVIPDFDRSRISIRPSKDGKYVSVTVIITATSREQLDNVYRALSGHDRIIMVL